MRRPHMACRRARPAPWMGWLLCLGVLLHHPAAAVETRVSTAREFAAALVDNGTDVVVLTTDLMVNPDNWATFSQDQPCKIQRNLLITSQPSLNVLNYGFLQAKCRIQPNVTVTYTDLVLSNTRYGSGTNIDFYVASPNATILTRNIVRQRLACVPARANPVQLRLLPRSPAAPGVQVVYTVPEFCMRGFCMENVTHFEDYAVVGALDADNPAYAGAYTLWYQNTTLVCKSLVTNECIIAKGQDQCVIEIINAALDSGAGASSGVPVVAIAVPVVLGCLLLVLLTAFLVWQRRRHARRRADEEQANAKLGKGTTSNGGPGSGHISNLLLGQTPKSADGWHMMAQRTVAEFMQESTDKIQLGVLIGAGAHGRVYKGHWQGQEVAVKVLQHNSSTAHRVARECNLIMGFSHANIVRAYHFVTWRQGDYHQTPPQSSQYSGQLQSTGSRQHISGGAVLQDSAAGMFDSRGGAGTSSSRGSSGAPLTAVQSVAALLRAGQQRQLQQADDDEEEQASTQEPPHILRQSSALASSLPAPSTSDVQVAVLSAGTFSDGVPATGLSDGSEHTGQVDAQTWLVTEYCDASTLHDVSRSGRLTHMDGVPTLDPLLWRLREVADAMCYLHSRNVLHGDLKSANVLCASAHNRPYGLVSKVSDFGLSLALAEGQTHKSTRALGTVTHMAPEMLRTGRLAPPCDVYSFGVLMWELLTSRYAFQGKHYGEIIERVVLHDERPPIPEDAPDDYVLLMSSCWAAKPKARPTFEAVRQCLDIMLQQRREEQEAAEAASPGLMGGLIPPVNGSVSGSYAGHTSSGVMSGGVSGGVARSHPSFGRGMGSNIHRTPESDPTEPNEGFF